jgi:hypothetical protein
MRILEELGHILKDGHNLKCLVIEFSDTRLREHVTRCYESKHSCGFRDQLNEALKPLAGVRNVPNIEIRGLNLAQAAELQQMMKLPQSPFLRLPQELRDLVYEEILDWSECSVQMSKCITNWKANISKKFPFPLKTTPGILLVNRQISVEAREVLHKKPLNIVFPGVSAPRSRSCHRGGKY